MCVLTKNNVGKVFEIICSCVVISLVVIGRETFMFETLLMIAKQIKNDKKSTFIKKLTYKNKTLRSLFLFCVFSCFEAENSWRRYMKMIQHSSEEENIQSHNTAFFRRFNLNILLNYLYNLDIYICIIYDFTISSRVPKTYFLEKKKNRIDTPQQSLSITLFFKFLVR